MSALFSITAPDDKLKDFLWAFIQGVELAGKFGKLLNPQLALRGWHTTGMIGTLAAAAAVGVYKKVTVKQMCSLLSLAATQTSGLEIQAGSDGKPFNAGMAARDAVSAYVLVENGFKANEDPFSNTRGWFKTIAGIDFSAQEMCKLWLHPAEISQPGLWFKQHPFCSAAMSGYDAAKILYQRGIRTKDCQTVNVHFPSGGDHALRYRLPMTGKEGKFSIEYIIWQVFRSGDVSDELFECPKVSKNFVKWQPCVSHKNDLETSDSAARPTKLTVKLKSGNFESVQVSFPEGSPKCPLSRKKLLEQLHLQVMVSGPEWINFCSKFTNPKWMVSELKQQLGK
ncbi:MmgE/PrpD family protein [Liquorilactobacillus oeni]|uniref:MmgE/PrpD N-terminal domain-containing protein n=1 Tax=Liquorilactobacillus oeni DSM 19972 TaxID=1423777 RepID=A0A0R1MLE8_9LACO|nr:MmgE/PrpD family protein [Liquorilactobacillus oeni]KRL05339.1 hypothetical protein FD46_GL000729 [Liquorilactobacillus oeni DSM 19972]